MWLYFYNISMVTVLRIALYAQHIFICINLKFLHQTLILHVHNHEYEIFIKKLNYSCHHLVCYSSIWNFWIERLTYCYITYSWIWIFSCEFLAISESDVLPLSLSWWVGLLPWLSQSRPVSRPVALWDHGISAWRPCDVPLATLPPQWGTGYKLITSNVFVLLECFVKQHYKLNWFSH